MESTESAGAMSGDFDKAPGLASHSRTGPGHPEVSQEEAEDRGWQEFREQCRRQMQRPMDERIKYGFFRMYKPVLDDAPFRSFDTMKDYRAWCAANLPSYLGFQPAKP